MHAIHRLQQLGQSVWLDFLDHQLIVTGELERMIEHDGLRGLTSNPTILEKAIESGSDFDELMKGPYSKDSDADIFERIAVREVGLACDRLRRAYDTSEGADGFASIEVSPYRAADTAGSIEDARRLWSKVARPNAMVKIPGTHAGLPAIERCLREGININITLLFSIDRYREVAEAYLRALEGRVADGKPIDRIASVASFFVSRVDTKADNAIDSKTLSERASAGAERGQTAIANAKLAFEQYESVLAGDRFRRLAARGARAQRVLWASTSTKDPAYGDLYYAEALIAPGTIDTMTKQTLRAYIDHGNPSSRLTLGKDKAREHIASLAKMGLDFARMTQELEDEGVRAFVASFDKAIETIARKRRVLASA